MKTLFTFLLSMIISCSMLGSSFIIPKKTAVSYNSVEDILNTIDPSILPHGVGSEEKGGSNLNDDYITVLNQKAGDLRSYIGMKYGEDFSNFSNEEIIVLGLIMVPFETRENYVGRVSNAQAFDCMMGAIGVATGLSGLYSLWTQGASTASILGTLRSILRFAGGWWMVGYGVWKFGECVGWW